MSAPGRKLAFLVAGVQKGGTSALFEYLREVPGLQLPAAKELHFFDDDEGIDWSAPDYARLHAAFADDDRLRGEATPISVYWPNAMERIHAYNPAMKLIVLVRDPIERAWSHWRMEYARGKERAPFAWCIREGRARLAEAAPHPGFHRVFSYVERGFYGRQLVRILSLFPRSQLLLLASRRVDREPDAALAAICDFLGVARAERPVTPRRVRAAPAIDYPSRLTPEDVGHLRAAFADEMKLFLDVMNSERIAWQGIVTPGTGQDALGF